MESSEVRSILVPIDFSECSRVALERAVALAERYFAATIDVLHVWDTSKESMRAGHEERQTREVEALRQMEEFLASVARKGAVKIERIHAFGAPVSKILEATRKKTYDLIVMGTHGKKSQRDRIGSVAEKIVGRATCPVLTYREPLVEVKS